MSFRRRTFPEILDSLLVDIAGGVAAETHPFPPKGATGAPWRFSLQRPPAALVVSVYGTRDGRPLALRPLTGFKLLPDGQTLELPAGSELPDPGTLLTVNYVPASARPVLTDLQAGSVVRTLTESIALEMGRLYAQLEAVYQAGFIDTATGDALEKVVALLGITRIRGGRPEGEVEFKRAAGTRGAVHILAGTRVLSADGNLEYETTAAVTLAEGQDAVRVNARDLEVNDPVPADTLTVIAIPLAGIAEVTNPAPTTPAAQDETDDELRARTRQFLHGSERATLGALKEAIARQQVSADVEEIKGKPGYVEVTPHLDAMPPELEARLRQAIEDARPAGIVVELKKAVPPARVDVDLSLSTAEGLTEADVRAAQRAVASKLKDYLARLPARQAGSVTRIIGLAMGVEGVTDVRITRAWVGGSSVLDTAAGVLHLEGVPTVLGELRLADPRLATRLEVSVTYPKSAAVPDNKKLEAEIVAALGYLNELNRQAPSSTSPAEIASRTLSFNRMLYVLSLPGRTGGSLKAFDAAGGTGTLPLKAAIAPYEVKVAIVQESGFSRTLEADNAAYTPVVQERLSLQTLRVTEASDG